MVSENGNEPNKNNKIYKTRSFYNECKVLYL